MREWKDECAEWRICPWPRRISPFLSLSPSFSPLSSPLPRSCLLAAGWATLLSHYYSRKADTLNRGYSGYNTNHVLAMMEQHIRAGAWPSNHAGSPASAPQRPTIVTLCLGANDSCLKECAYSAAQSVPVDAYRANLASILALLKGADGTKSPDLHVIVIGPPQCDAHMWGENTRRQHITRAIGRWACALPIWH